MRKIMDVTMGIQKMNAEEEDKDGQYKDREWKLGYD